MRSLLAPLLLFQRFLIPALLILLVWAAWRTIAKKDFAIGLGLYAVLVVVVDGFYNTGIFLPGMSAGSIRYSEVCAMFLFAARPAAPERSSYRTGVLVLFGLYFLLLFVAGRQIVRGIMDGAVKAWGLEILATNPREFSSSLTAILMPDGHDADHLRDVILERFNMSLGQGLGKVKGKVFRIGHLGDFNDLMLAGTLAGVEMGLAIDKVPFKRGGTQAALDYLAGNN